jgi:hypothetical protein
MTKINALSRLIKGQMCVTGRTLRCFLLTYSDASIKMYLIDEFGGIDEDDIGH